MYHPPLPEQEQTSDIFRELLSPELMAAVESDETIECPCMDEDLDDEYEVCVGEEGGCPRADLEFPEFSEDDALRIRNSVRRGLDRRMEIVCEQTQGRLPCPAHRSQSEYDP